MIKSGNKVTVHYTGKFENNEVFDSSENKQPISFVVGQNQVIPGFEDAVLGLDKGGKVNITIDPDNAYGQIVESLIVEVAADQVPGDVQVGANLQGTDNQGQLVNVVVKDVTEGKVILDGNHPLAGKTLTFDIEVVDFE